MKHTSYFESYIETALWSSTDWDGDHLDANYSIDDFDTKTLEKLELELDLFIEKAGSLLDGLDLTYVAHDFWLTRNGHGAGFWDGDYTKVLGEKLTDLSKQFGEIDLYVGDDNKIYVYESLKQELEK